MSITDISLLSKELREIVTYNLDHVPPCSGNSFPILGGPVNSIFNALEPVVKDYITICQCIYCGTEYILDQQILNPPAFCGEGIGGACGAAEWRFFKRLIEVVDESDRGVSTGVITKQHYSVISFNSPCSGEAIDQLRETWKQQPIDMTPAKWRDIMVLT